MLRDSRAKTACLSIYLLVIFKKETNLQNRFDIRVFIELISHSVVTFETYWNASFYFFKTQKL